MKSGPEQGSTALLNLERGAIYPCGPDPSVPPPPLGCWRLGGAFCSHAWREGAHRVRVLLPSALTLVDEAPDP
jgi:hypothetical protein